MNWTLVTGGAKGLGKAVVQQLAKHGYPVVIHYKTSEQEALALKAECQAKGAQAEVIQGDLFSAELALNFAGHYLARFPHTQNLVNNVGTYFVGSALNVPLDTWHSLIATNLQVPVLLAQALMPSLIHQKGTITNIGVAGLTKGADSYSTLYTAVKGGLLHLTRSLAKELAPKGVRINMVSPGYMENAIDLPNDLSKIPTGKVSSLEEVASFIVFLMDPKNSSITGQNIEIAGGVRL